MSNHARAVHRRRQSGSAFDWGPVLGLVGFVVWFVGFLLLAAGMRGRVSETIGLLALAVWLFAPVDAVVFVLGRGRTSRDQGFDRVGPLLALTAPLVIIAVACLVAGAAIGAFVLLGLVSVPWSLLVAKWSARSAR